MSRSEFKSLRLFISIRLDASALQAWENFRAQAPEWPLRWIPPDLMHITLKFLGQTPNDLEPKIVANLKEAVQNTSPFSLRLKGGGIFPLKGSPSIFWVGVDSDGAPLTALAAAIEGACQSSGFPMEERGFHPHLTVARVQSQRGGGKNFRWLRDGYQKWIAAFESPPFVVEEVRLMQSLLFPQVPQYQDRAVIRL